MKKYALNTLKYINNFILVVCLLLTQQAYSAGPTQLALVGFRTEQHDFENRLRDELFKKLSSQKNISMIPEVVTNNYVSGLWREEAKASKNKVSKARKQFIEGKKLYDKLALDQAIRKFNRSVISYREGVGALKDNRYLLVSHLYLGMSLIVLGKEKEGQQYIREMIILDPKRETRVLSKREFPPRVIQLHKAMTQKVLKGPAGELKIDVDPAGAKIYLNGLLQKYEGVFSANLPIGEHFVVVERKGYRQIAKPVQIGAQNNTMKITLEEWQPLSPYSLERRNNLIALDDLGNISKELSAKMLVLGKVQKVQDKEDRYSLQGQVYDARSREFSKIQKVETSLDKMDRAIKNLSKKIINQITTQGLVVADIRTTDSVGALYGKTKEFETKASKNHFEDKKRIAKREKIQKEKKRKSSGNVKSKKWIWYGLGAAAVITGGYFLYDSTVGESTKNTLTVTPQ